MAVTDCTAIGVCFAVTSPLVEFVPRLLLSAETVAADSVVLGKCRSSGAESKR